MGFDRRFTLVLCGWVLLLAATMVALAASWSHAGLGATRLLLAIVIVAALVALVRHVGRTNMMLARFVEALRHGDFAVRFDRRGGAAFAVLGDALSAAMRDLQAQGHAGREELRYWEALVDDLPVALLTVDSLHGVRLINKAARNLFDRSLEAGGKDLAIDGEGLGRFLAMDGPLAQEILSLRFGGGRQRVMVRAALLSRLGTPVRVVAVEPVQTTLDAVEVGLQTDLVRVLTHEILNSLTPVTSLAETAAALLDQNQPDIAEARLAVTTLARRAEGMRHFIDSYRTVARPPEPRRRHFAAAPFAAELGRLFEVEWVEHRLTLDIDPALVLDADPDLLAQLLINLLRNAAQATERNAGQGHVRLGIAAGQDERALIEVEDNGPGIPIAIRSDVFLPFFTTRAAGTGVGLSLARQIAVAHGWRLEVGDSRLGGARVRLVTGQAVQG